MIITIVSTWSSQLRECDQFLDEIDRIVSSLAGGRLSQVIITITNINNINNNNNQALVPGPLLRQHLSEVESSLPKNFTLLYPAAGGYHF